MEKRELKLKDIVSYLPYGLSVKVLNGHNTIHKLLGLTNKGVILKDVNEVVFFKNISIFLNPLSDLTKEIEHNGEKFVPIHIFYPTYPNFKYAKSIAKDLIRRISLNYNKDEPTDIPAQLTREEWKKLHEWHFDINNLIDSNLALNKNEI